MNERARFEKWARETFGSLVNLSEAHGIYADSFAMAMYTGWQARAAEKDAEIERLREALKSEGWRPPSPATATEARTQPVPKDE